MVRCVDSNNAYRKLVKTFIVAIAVDFVSFVLFAWVNFSRSCSFTHPLCAFVNCTIVSVCPTLRPGIFHIIDALVAFWTTFGLLSIIHTRNCVGFSYWFVLCRWNHIHTPFNKTWNRELLAFWCYRSAPSKQEWIQAKIPPSSLLFYNGFNEMHDLVWIYCWSCD